MAYYTYKCGYWYTTSLQYQSEVFNRPHVDQQDPRNLSSFEFRPPDAMIRDRRSWHTETHQEASFHRSGRIQRRRKSHLDDIYGPNYEDNYRAERYRRFKPEHRTLTSIKSYTPKKFDYSTRREISKTVIDSPKQSTKETADKNSNSESVSSSRINFNANKIAPDEENANEANKNSQCSDSIELKSTNKCFSLGTDRASTNFTKQAVELDEIESCEEDYENSTKENREKCGKDEIKSNEEDQQKVTKEDEQKVTKLDEENSIKDEIPTSSTSLPVPFPVANNEPKPLSPKSENFHTEVKNNIQIEVETSITIHHDDAGVITATYLTEHSKAIQDEFEKEMESDETISLDDSITIDQIDTGKSFLEDTFELADDYRVIDMDVDTPSPAKRRKLDSTIETKLEPNELYPVIECEQLLNELTFVINGKCDNEIVENTNKKKESSLSAGSEKYPVIQLNQPQDSNNPSKISAENNKTKEKSIEYIQDTSLKNTRSKPKQKDKRKSENCHPEEIKNVRRKSREPSKNNKMSTNYYPALANYTIPKVNIEKKKFSDIDEPYMNKMQSLFGIDYDDEDDQKQDKIFKSKKNHADEKSKKRRDKEQHHARKHSTDNKNSIPKSSKSSDADCQKIRSSKQYEEKCGNRRKSSKHVSGSTKISTPAEEKRRGHEERRSKSSRTELPEANSKSHTNKETGRDHIHKKSLNGKLSSKSERYEKIEKSHAKKVIANNEIKNNLAKSVDGKRRYSETGLHTTTGLITERRHSLQVSDKVSVNEKAMELYQKDKSEKLEIQIKLTRFVNAITEQSVSEKNEEDCIKLKMEQNTEKHVFCSTAQENNVLGATTDVNKLRDIERTMEEIHSVESSSKVKMPIEVTVSPNPCKKTLKEVISEIIPSQSTLEEIHSAGSSSKDKMPMEDTNSPNPLCKKTLKEVISEIISSQSTLEEIHSVGSSSKVKMPMEDTISPNSLCKKTLKEVISEIISSQSVVENGLEVSVDTPHTSQSGDTISSKLKEVVSEIISSESLVGNCSELSVNAPHSSSQFTECAETYQEITALNQLSSKNEGVSHASQETSSKIDATLNDKLVSSPVKSQTKDGRTTNHDDTFQDELRGCDEKNMEDDKTSLKIIPFVKIALICEPVFEVERCSPLDRSCPQFHRVRYCSVVCECNEEATVMESPEVEYSLEVKRIPDNKSPVDHLESTDGDDLFDDVIEIKPSIPLIDLTEEQCGIEKPDLAEDLLGLLGTSDKSLENITIYRSDETSNSSLEVQAMSASFTPRVLGTTMPKKVEAKVEPNESNQMIVIELNPNISTDEKNSTESQAGTQQMEILANGVDALNGSVTVNRPETENANALESSELIPENMSSESNNSLFTTSVVNRTTGSSDATDSTGSNQQNNCNIVTSEGIQTNNSSATNPMINNNRQAISSNDMPNADIPATSQIPENIENDSNSLTRLTRFVHSSGSQANIPLNRSNGAELIQPSAYNRTNAISQSSRMNTGNLDLAFGSEVNSETVIPDFQSTVTVLANGRVPNLSQQEYSVAAVITQYMNLMIFIRRNQSIYEQSLMQATIQPELQQLEVKLSKQMYIEKLQKYSTFIIFHLKTLCLSGNMTAVTADATVDFISRNVCKVNPCVTKLAVILYLERLLEPQKQFYTSIPYLASFYNHVQFLCTQIRRRVPPSGPIPGTSICREQLAPDQMKVLQYQIQQYLQIVDIERSRHTNAASKNPNSQEIDLRNGYLYQTLNSPTKQKSGNERSERTSKSKINGSKTSQVVMDNFKNPAPISDLPNVNRRRSPLNHHQTSNSAYNPSAALQSPSHRPEVFVNASHVSPVAVRNQTHSIISSSSANLSTTLRSPTHMPEGIHPPVYSTFHNQSQLNNPHMSPARNSILQKSPAHIPEGLQTQALSSVSNLRQMNNLPFMSPAQTPVRSAPNQNQTNYISFMSSARPTPIMRSPAHRPEGIQLQACSMPNQSQTNSMTFVSPVQPPVHSSVPNQSQMENMTAMSPVHQPRRNPAHRQEGIQPQPYLSPSQSRPNNMLCMSPAQPYNSKSPVHRPEGNQMQAYSCNSPQSQINTVSYMSPARPSITTKSSANRPLGMQPPVNPSIVPNQSGLTNFVFTHPAHSTTLRSPAHKPDSIVKSPRRVESNQSQMSRISQNSALHPMASIQTDVPSIVQSASNDKVTHSPGHLSAVQLSPAHRTEGRRLGFKLPKNSLITGGSSNSPPVTEQLVRMSPSHVMNRNSPVMDQNSPVMYQNSPVPASTNHQSISPTNTLSNASMDTSLREAAAIQSSSSEIPSATPCQTMPNLINIRSPVYAPMLFSPENFPQDGSEGESAQNNAEEESCSDDAIETIDLTWLDEVDEEQIQNEINFIAVKKEEPEDGEVILNQEQFPVEECSELVYTDRLCICEKPAEYLCRCRMAMYCSSSCQTRDWKDHRSICIRYVAKK